MYRCRFLPFLSTYSSRSSLEVPFGSDNDRRLAKRTRVLLCEKVRPKARTDGGRGFGRFLLSGVSDLPQGESESIMCNSSLPAKQMPIFSGNHSESASTLCHRRKITTYHSARHENLTEVVEHFISTEKGETCCCIKEMCGLYIEKLCKLGNLKDAVSLLGHLHNRQMHPNLHTYNTLLAAAVEINCFHIFCDVFRILLLSKLPPDPTTYRRLAKALLSSSDSKVLLGFIRQVSEMTAHTDPTVVNRILFTTAKSGQIDKCLMMFEELKGFKFKIDTVTFNTVLAILGRAGRVDEMLSEYSLMKERGFSPDIVTYDTLINCLRRLGRLDLCRAFVKEMVESGFEMDLQSYTALIDVLGRAGRVNDALILFVEMKKFHRPSIYVYRAMIANLKKFGKIQAAVDLLEEMKSSTSKLIGPDDFRKKRRDGVR